MKRILFFFLLTALPFLAAAQGTIPDTIRVLTDAQINFGSWADSVRMYFIQGGTWKKQRMDTLAQYVATKVGGVTTFSAGTTGFTPSTATSGAVTLAGTLSIANGGTNATTASQARTNLGLAIGTDVLAPNGSAANLTNFPTLNQNTTGTAANVTGTVAVANGGTGQQTQQAAINALAGATTSGQYLRGNGTNVTMSAIQAGDVPTLNQNTTGSAASLTTARDIQVNLASTSAASFNGTANITPGVTGQLAGGNIATGAVGATQLASTAVSAGTYRNARLTVDEDGRLTAANSDTLAMIIACSDETTAITATGTRVTFRAPFAMTIVGVRASLTTASSSGLPRVDIFENTGSGFTSIFTTRLTINQGALTSVGATTPAVINDANIANDSAIRIDYDQVGTGAAGLKVTILYIRP